jgi:hypothetical protein
MIIDDFNTFSRLQAITATAPSADTIDLGPLGGVPNANLVQNIGIGEPSYLVIRVGQVFNTLTSLTVDVQTDDAIGFGSPIVLATTGAIPLAQLTANTVVRIIPLPPANYERYIRLNYTVTGTNPTTGTIDAFIVTDVQQYRAYADAQPITALA